MLPITDSGPGFGGAKTQKSFIEFTREKNVIMTAQRAFHLFSGGRSLTVGVLTLGRLIGAGPALVGPLLSSLRLSRGVGRGVCSRVSLCVDADEAEVEN